MKVIRRIASFALGLVALLALVIAGYATWVAVGVRTGVAAVEGTHSGLAVQAEVRVVRDDRDVPHIKAHSIHDLFFAQGYVAGSDRLFQIDVTRRYVLGELSELLGDYIDSLHKVKTIGASGVLPAHGEPFPDLDRRVDQLLAHEETREGQVLDRLSTAGSASAADIARALPWTRKNRDFTELSEAHQQFAVAETIAHLEHLRLGRRVTRDASETAIVYATA